MFETNTTTMSLNVTYLYDGCEMYHFPTSGVCGMDLYALDTVSQRWRWVSTTTQNEYPYSVNSMTVVPSNGMTKYKLHLPTYNGVVNLKIGVDENAVIDRYDDQKTKKILWYGTSITQGGVSSRPGQIFTNIISRDLDDVRIFNFGFSGNGLMSLKVAEALVRVPDVSMFVIDCSWNMNSTLISNRTVPLIQYLRNEYNDGVPIILAEDTRAGQRGSIRIWVRSRTRDSACGAFETLIAQGVENLFYVSRDALFNFTEFGYQNLFYSTAAGTCVLYLSSPTFPTQKKN